MLGGVVFSGLRALASSAVGASRCSSAIEVFNFFNHPNFKLPESYIDNPATFGRILAAEPARQIQFGLKYLF